MNIFTLGSLVWRIFSKKMLRVILFSGIPFYQVVGQNLQELTRLPAILNETSGIEVTGKNKIWSFNDSGGNPELYLIDTMGHLLRTLLIENAQNRDWEDLSQDGEGNFYIGDIGNNNNNRQDLVIYKIPPPDAIPGESVAAEQIRFSYEDQSAFPPPGNQLIYDCEALMWFAGSLYVCTKNRTVPFDGKTHLYQIPDLAGTYLAKKIDEWDTGGNNITSFWITSGDISDDGKFLTLLSGDKMWLFYDFNGNNFFAGKKTQIDFTSNTQKEGICFVNNNEFYITDEEWFGGVGRKLYKISIDLLSTGTFPANHSPEIVISPNPCRDKLVIESEIEIVGIEVYDVAGNRFETSIQISGTRITIDTVRFPQGIYFIRVEEKIGNRLSMHRIIKTNDE